MRPGTSKTVVTMCGTGVTNGATVTANIDTLGCDYAEIDVILGTANTTSNKPSTLKLAECDTTVVTDFANITGYVGGTDFTVVAADTANPNIYRFNIDCRHRKRYLKVTVTPLTTQEAIVVAHLMWPEQAQVGTATGFQQVVSG